MTVLTLRKSLGDCQYLLPVNNCDNRKPAIRYRRIAFWLVAFTLSLLLLFAAHYTNRTLSFRETSFDVSKTPGYELEKLWAQYSPYYAAGEYQNPPPGCRVSQVNILQRHGGRFPTLSALEEIQLSVEKLKAARPFSDSKLLFLNDYDCKLGSDTLVPLGAEESLQAGMLQFMRYHHLVTHDDLPFVRASQQSRVIDSATNWTAGFALASNGVYEPKLALTIPESNEANNTLANKLCPNHKTPSELLARWQDVYSPSIADRLSRAAPGANLTPKDVPHLMSLCAFETVAYKKKSSFCGLFSIEEFREYDYAGDLNKYYGFGYGHLLGPIQGVGYVNELLARLTNTPVRDGTQTNRTLDGSRETFPLNRTIYVDFSHDNTMAAVYSAIGLFKQPQDLDPVHPDPSRTWVTSKLVPFAARMVTEKIECSFEPGKEFVRIMVNDALQPLEFCGGKGGLCELSAFVESQGYARTDGNGGFGKCYE